MENKRSAYLVSLMISAGITNKLKDGMDEAKAIRETSEEQILDLLNKVSEQHEIKINELLDKLKEKQDLVDKLLRQKGDIE